MAKMAGVSTTTVSRILSGAKTSVAYSEATRQRVRQAAEALNYVPSFHASRLIRRRADTVALILRYVETPIYVELAEQFVRAFSEFNLRVSLDLVDISEAATIAAIRNFTGGMVDAIFLYPNHPSMPFEGLKTAAAGCPLICLSQKPSDPVPYVAVDRREAAHQATRHLVGLGRRRIGYVGIAHEADGRFTGYQDALREAGITADPAWQVCDNFFLLERGQEAGRKLARLPNPPDAIFVASDLLAIGVIAGLAKEGVRTPDDVAMVSFDGTKVGAYFSPALTTMAVPLPQMARQALAMVQAIHAGKTADEIFAMSTLLQASLVVRESCGSKGGRGEVASDGQPSAITRGA